MIVTLVHKIPGDCARYFPKKIGGLETYDDIQVLLKGAEQVDTFIYRRDVEVYDTTQKRKVSLSHYHF